jgi:hypothetical protein
VPHRSLSTARPAPSLGRFSGLWAGEAQSRLRGQVLITSSEVSQPRCAVSTLPRSASTYPAPAWTPPPSACCWPPSATR